MKTNFIAFGGMGQLGVGWVGGRDDVSMELQDNINNQIWKVGKLWPAMEDKGGRKTPIREQVEKISQ